MVNAQKKNIEVIEFDAIVVGGGGSGLRAALELSRSGLRTAVVSKVFPLRSHTVSAQGGINAALGNIHQDQWQWHMHDTVVGSDFLGDQDSIEMMCRDAPQSIIELEHMGMPFSRNEDGTIYQRSFGGQTCNDGKDIAVRTCCVQDRTGHALLHTLYQQNVASVSNFLNEWFVVDLIMDGNGRVAGVSAIEMATGRMVFLKSTATVLATGGAGQIFQSNTNAHICTGDGMAMVYRKGIGLQDMEMWQFHPTGLQGTGILISEGARGEGGILLNANGERFMARYAPHLKDLSCRDVVARCSMKEIREGRGCGPEKDHVLLQLHHLDPNVFEDKLPGITQIAQTYVGIDPRKTPIPVVPTCHYAMGGIPCNYQGQVIKLDSTGRDTVVQGLFAIGECANVSVHGANRLGANSLLDLVVLGRACGQFLHQHIGQIDIAAPSQDDIDHGFARCRALMRSKNGHRAPSLRKDMKRVMQEDFGVFRDHSSMEKGLQHLEEIRKLSSDIVIHDHSDIFNTELYDALEFQNLLEVAYATAISAFHRKESRGAHSRVDFPHRNDKEWQKHTVVHQDGQVKFRSVNLAPRFTKPIKTTLREH